MKLSDYLKNYLKENIYPFHMPGNKRMTDGTVLDFTEVEHLDNLYHSNGILQEMTDRIKALYKTKESLVLVNGSTTGILTAITSVTSRGDSILIARNCHKAVYNAVELWDLTPTYIVPKYNHAGMCKGISPFDVENAINSNSSIKACVITSPTYEGIVSDVKAIADICHKKGVVLIVDEAHGSHLSLSDYFPCSAICSGADIVIHSTHKTLTSLTGTGLLHICSDRIDIARIKKRYQAFQTSSPNYIMMSSVDDCICDIINKGKELFLNYQKRLDSFYEKSKTLKNLKIFDEDTSIFDRGKIVILTNGTSISGTQLQTVLREKYKIETEMATISYCLAMTSINDTDEGFQRLINALTEIDRELLNEEHIPQINNTLPQMIYTPAAVEDMPCEAVSLDNICDRVSKEYIYAYPPGVPIIVPGEKFNKEIVEDIKNMMKNGVNVLSESNNLPITALCTIDT